MKIKEGDLVLSNWKLPPNTPRLQGIVTQILSAPNDVSEEWDVIRVFWVNAKTYDKYEICEYYEKELELVAKS